MVVIVNPVSRELRGKNSGKNPSGLPVIRIGFDQTLVDVVEVVITDCVKDR